MTSLLQQQGKEFVHSWVLQGIIGNLFCIMLPYIATPLTDLTRKSQPNKVVWTPDCTESFQKLKNALCSAPILQSPNFDEKFILQTDASDRGIGAVLSQLDEDGMDHPVSYFS